MDSKYDGSKLFGLDFIKLCDAIAQVESDGGKTSKNMFQIRDCYIDDVNRINHVNWQKGGEWIPVFTKDAKFSPTISIEMMWYYWKHYGEAYRRATGKRPTYEVLARIHNGGPRGYAKKATDPYWAKVNKELSK